MKTPDSTPAPDILSQDTWMLSEQERKRVLKTICNSVVTKFTNFHLPVTPSDSQLNYSDQILGYAKELMSLGLFYMEYTDAVHEGDGDRVLRCWRYLFPLFKYSGRKNYTKEAFNMLFSYHFTLSQRQAHQLIWSRFVNTTGLPGRNIACDLHMEHLNRVCKEAVCGLGANKTPKAITRIGKCIGVLMPVLENYDKGISISAQSGRHSVPSSQRDRDMIINELLLRNILDETPGRAHSCFANLSSSLLNKIDYNDLSKWIIQHVPYTT